MGKWGLTLIFFVAVPAFAQPRAIEPGAADSAYPTATVVLRHLSEGNIEAAAALSNAPQRRFEVLRDYRNSIGEEEFKRVFGRYFAPENRLIAEVAIGPRRLLVWELGEAGNRLVGQFYIELDGRFVMDDVPSRERSELRGVLEKLRKKSGSDPNRENRGLTPIFPSRRGPAGRARRQPPPSPRRAPRAAGAGAGGRLRALPA